MMCYKDITYCPFWLICTHGGTCEKAYTDDVREAAERWWGGPGAPVCLYNEFPECYKRWFVEEEKEV